MSAFGPKRTFASAPHMSAFWEQIVYAITLIAKCLVSVAATGCTICRHQIRRGRCFVLCRRRPIVCCLLSGRRYADAKSAVGRAAMRELSRTDLGGEKVACRIG